MVVRYSSEDGRHEGFDAIMVEDAGPWVRCPGLDARNASGFRCHRCSLHLYRYHRLVAVQRLKNFHSLYSHDFVRIASSAPCTKVADVSANLAETIRLASAGSAAGAAIIVFPELGLSSYAIEDLLFQDALLAAVETTIDELINVLAAFIRC